MLMIKKKDYWFKPAKAGGRLTIANSKGLALIISYAAVIGLAMSLVSVFIEDDKFSAWVGVPIAVSVCAAATAGLMVTAIQNSKYGKKK